MHLGLLADLEDFDEADIKGCLECPYPECYDCKGKNAVKMQWDFSKYASYSSLMKMKLTETQRSVIEGIKDGLSDKAIAKNLGITQNTVFNLRHQLNIPCAPKYKLEYLRKAYGVAWSLT